MAITFNLPRSQIADGNGDPYPGAKLYFYEPGTTTQRNVYQDADLTSLHMQPVVANSAGRWPAIFLPTGTYKARVETATGVLIFEEDDLDPGVATGPGALPVASGGTGATNAAAARSNLSAASATDVSTLQSTVTTFEAKVSPSYVGGTRLGTLAGKDDLAITDLGTSFGSVVCQETFWSSAAVVTGTAATPAFDNSIPQIGEGTEVWSDNFTPKNADSVIRVTAVLQLGGGVSGSNGNVMCMLFDGSSNAKALGQNYSNNTYPTTAGFCVELPSWGLTAKTLSVRIGSAAQPYYLNGVASFSQGGSYTSSILVQEIKRGPF